MKSGFFAPDRNSFRLRARASQAQASGVIALSARGSSPNSEELTPEAQMVEWIRSDTPVPYEEALAFMEARVAAIAAGTADEAIWLLEHPPLYTAGTSARREDLVDPDRFPVHEAGRGGQYTYHGPGQRIVYVMLDLNRRGRDVRCFVRQLERWVIDTLAEFNVTGEIRGGRVGVWVARPEKGIGADGQPAEDKIAAIGVKLRRWVSFHGISINVEPDLSHFAGIIPCGIRDHGVTSLVDLGLPVTMEDLDAALESSFGPVFDDGRTPDRCE
ncbi:lipoyl(octanoyl) transferase LipB [Sedimentimonas flavescens]|uniref:Octanoyltransferase n=1 Tax=Sedimentimonas flavescens TaxID=2851012 RepID=A0ABT3A0M9_9RHOB|nr:lipoyl(octanoyl) transferase LipB [Sedimentimonas flavescens]MCV2879562.1 lipoyl(octanoyl) transferase LipB [Sedimentimonas flavescens]